MKILKDSGLYILSGIMPAAANLIVLQIYLQYISPEEYGVFGLIQIFIAILPLCFTFLIHNSINRLYFDCDDIKDIKKYYSTLMNFSILLSLIILLILYLFLEEIIFVSFPSLDREYYLYFKLASYIALFEALYQLGISLIRVERKAKLYFLINMLMLLFRLSVGVYAIVFMGLKLDGLVYSQLVAVVIGALATLLYSKKYLGFCFEFKLLKRSLIYSLPLIPHSLAAMIFMYSDRFVLEKYVSMSALGLYFLGDRLSQVGKILVNQFNASFSPVFINSARKSYEDSVFITKNIANTFLSFYVIIFSIGSLFALEIFNMLFPAEYKESATYFLILMTAYYFRSLYCFLSQGVFYLKKTYLIPLITFAAGCLNLLLNYQLIPIYGVISAAWTTVLSMALTAIIAGYISQKIYPIHLNLKEIIYNILFMFVLMFMSLIDYSNFQYQYVFVFFKLLILVFLIRKLFLTFNLIKENKAWRL